VARGLLPATVAHADAAANAGRAALLVAALSRQPELLLTATEDRLHQAYREPAMPPTLSLVHRLRAAGVPAVVSGAGPSVLAFTGHHTRDDVLGRVPAGWQALALEIDQRGAVVEVDA
jgi:homoserine kinase